MGYLHAFGVSRRNRVERRYLPSAKFGLSRFISDISVPFWPQIVIFGVCKQRYLGCLRFTRTADNTCNFTTDRICVHGYTVWHCRRSSARDAPLWTPIDDVSSTMTSVRWHSFSTSARVRSVRIRFFKSNFDQTVRFLEKLMSDMKSTYWNWLEEGYIIFFNAHCEYSLNVVKIITRAL